MDSSDVSNSSSSLLFRSMDFLRRASHSSADLCMDEVGEFKAESHHEVSPPRSSKRAEHLQIDIVGSATLIDHAFDEIIRYVVFHP